MNKTVDHEDATHSTLSELSRHMDQFELIRRVPSGSPGVLHVARDLALGRYVLLRFVPARLSAAAEHDERARGGLRALFNLVHRNVAAFHSAGRSPQGALYVVSENVAGPTLKKHLHAERPLTLADARRAIEQIGAALSAAHRLGICHGFLTAESAVVASGEDEPLFLKIVDFAPHDLPEDPGADGWPDVAADVAAAALLARDVLAAVGKTLPVRPPDTSAAGPAKAPPASGTIRIPSEAQDEIFRRATHPRAGEAYSGVEDLVRDLLGELDDAVGSFSRAATQPDERGEVAPPLPSGGHRVTVVAVQLTSPWMDQAFEDDESIECWAHVGEKIAQIIAPAGGFLPGPVADRFLIIFGLTTTENDSELAVDAALAVRELVRGLEGDPAIPPTFSLTVHVGVDHGLMIVASSPGGAVLHGKPANGAEEAAARAGPGEIRITHEVHRRVHGLYESTPMPTGTSRSDRRVEKKRSTASLPLNEIHGVRVELVGREAEMSALRGALSMAISERSAIAAVVSGPAGAGKSRLAHELIHEVVDNPPIRAYVDLLRCPPRAGETSPYEPFVQAIRTRAHISPEDTDQEASLRLESYLRRDLGVSKSDQIRSLVERLSALLGISLHDQADRGAQAEEVRRKALFDAMSEVYRRMSATMPVIVLLDDYSFATEPTKALLSHLHGSLADSPVLFVILLRAEHEVPVVEESFVRDTGRLLGIAVAPLSREATEQLVSHVLRALPHVPGWLLREIASLSGGLPLIIEETVRDLVDRGTILTHDEVWALSSAAEPPLVPPDAAEELFARRVRRIPPELLPIVRAAAVSGRRFWPRLIGELAGYAVPPRAIAELVQARIFSVPSERPAAGEHRYTFTQPALREIVYREIPEADRVMLHRRAAGWLERKFIGQKQRHDAEIGDHYLRANERERALPYLLRAADSACHTYAAEEAISALEACLQIVEPGGPLERQITRAKIVADLAEQLALAGDLTRAASLAKPIVDSANPEAPLALRRPLARLAIRGGRALEALGEFRPARSAFARARSLAPLDDLPLQLTALAAHVGVEVKLGPSPALVDELRDAVARPPPADADSMAWSRAASFAHRILGNALVRQEQYEGALVPYQKALDLAWSIVSPAEIVDAWNGIAAVHFYRDHYEEATKVWLEALEYAERYYLLQHLSVLLNNLGEAELEKGDFDHAHEHLRRAKAIHTHLRSNQGLADTHRLFAEHALRSGDLPGAQQNAQRALEIAGSLGSPYIVGVANRTMANILFERLAVDPSRAMVEGAGSAAVQSHFDEAIRKFSAAGLPREAERTRALADRLLRPSTDARTG